MNVWKYVNIIGTKWAWKCKIVGTYNNTGCTEIQNQIPCKFCRILNIITYIKQYNFSWNFKFYNKLLKNKCHKPVIEKINWIHIRSPFMLRRLHTLRSRSWLTSIFRCQKKFRAEKGRQQKEFTVDRMWQLLCFCGNTYLIFNQI